MSVEEAYQVIVSVCENEMYGWRFVASLTAEQIASACNGIGPESWPQERRALLDRWLATFRLAADVHDCRFTFDNDGSREKFDAANDELEKNCLLLADIKYAWWNPLRYFARNRARLIARACRDFGWSAWKAAYCGKEEMMTTKTPKYFVEYGALQERTPEGPRRVIECDTSGLPAVKIPDDFAHEIAEALNKAEEAKNQQT